MRASVLRRYRALVAYAMTLCTACLVVAAALPAAAEPPEGHLSFFRQNRDFVLRAFERLPQDEDAARTDGRQWDFDPFAAWDASERVGAVRAALDTATTPAHLGTFRMSLGELLDESAAAAARLDELDRLFRAHLRTALEVTLESEGAADVQRVQAWLDGEHVADLALSDAERSALGAGGILEVLRQVIEPRTQDLVVHVWLAGHSEPRVATQAVEPVADTLRRVHFRIATQEPVVQVEESTLGGSR